jgi:hypothetical protein
LRAIVLGLIGLLASLVQVVLMVVRSGMLVILAGILPTTAAFTNTEMGKQWFQKAVGWTIAFILYKPAAAIVYSVAFLLMGNGDGKDVLIRSITGFTLMVVALFALPALMRFVTPMVGAVASGGGAGAGAAVGAMATGAVSLGRSGSGSGRGNAAPTPPTTQSNQPGASPKGSGGTPGPKGRGQPTQGPTGPGGPGGATSSAGAGAGATAGTAGAATGASKGAAYKEPSYGNWRVPRSAGLGNLGAIGTGIVMAGLLLGITTFAIWGLFPGLAVLAVAGASALLLTVKDKHGQSVVDRFGTRMSFRLSKSSGTNLYRSGPLGVTQWGMYQLPGLAAKSTLYEFTDSYKRPFALLHVPTTSHFTVIFSTEPDGASLVDPEQVDAWVANWGGWLAGLADEAGLDAAAVTVETAPDSGYRLRNEVLMNIDPNAPDFAKNVLNEVVETYPEGSATVRAWVSLTFNASLRVGSKKRTPEDVARDLASRIPGLSARLQSTGAGIARPMSAQELCEVVRIAYDPPAALIIDEAHAAGSPVSLSWGEVGPTATQASWDEYRHDSAFSVSWTMTGAPRGSVNSSVLSRLLAPHGDIDRKRISLLYRPMDSARAAAVVERDQNNANVRITSGTRPSARALVDARSAVQTAQEEAQGAGLVNFGMVVTATVTDRERLDDAVAAVEQTSGTARVLLRRAYGAQDTAFAASLPLGLVLPKHSMVPSEIKDAL